VIDLKSSAIIISWRYNLIFIYCLKLFFVTAAAECLARCFAALFHVREDDGVESAETGCDATLVHVAQLGAEHVTHLTARQYSLRIAEKVKFGQNFKVGAVVAERTSLNCSKCARADIWRIPNVSALHTGQRKKVRI
jgi:hypothetical protein